MASPVKLFIALKIFRCESKNDNFSFFTFNLMGFIKVRFCEKQGSGQYIDDFFRCDEGTASLRMSMGSKKLTITERKLKFSLKYFDNYT